VTEALVVATFSTTVAYSLMAIGAGEAVKVYFGW
jgi:hypothetical protein